MNYAPTQFGFNYGAATVERLCSDDKKGWIVLGVKTPKLIGHGLQIYVTKTGKVRVYDNSGEWKPVKKS